MKRHLNREGIPAKATDWLEADWQDLFEALDAAYAKIRERHREKNDVNRSADDGWAEKGSGM